MALFDVEVKGAAILTIAATNKAAATRAARKAFTDGTLDLDDLDLKFDTTPHAHGLVASEGEAKPHE